MITALLLRQLGTSQSQYTVAEMKLIVRTIMQNACDNRYSTLLIYYTDVYFRASITNGLSLFDKTVLLTFTSKEFKLYLQNLLFAGSTSSKLTR